MATDSARLTGLDADATAAEPVATSGLRSLRTQPFFSDKDQAFWVLQSAGWTGYFMLRMLTGYANSQGVTFIVHALLLTATGYSLTLLMGAAFRRLINMKGLITWPATVAIVVAGLVLALALGFNQGFDATSVTILVAIALVGALAIAAATALRAGSPLPRPVRSAGESSRPTRPFVNIAGRAGRVEWRLDHPGDEDDEDDRYEDPDPDRYVHVGTHPLPFPRSRTTAS